MLGNFKFGWKCHKIHIFREDFNPSEEKIIDEFNA